MERFIQQCIRFVPAIVSIMTVSACGGASSSPTASDINQDIGAILDLSNAQGGSTSTTGTAPVNVTTTTINALSVTGTSAKVGDVTPINPAENNGIFLISWNVTSSDPYHVDVYLSLDDTISTAQGDIRVFQQNCGSLPQLYSCNESADFACSFNGSNELYCGTVSAANPVRNLTTFLSAIPLDANLIFKACNSVLSNCKEVTVPVQFQ
jgi:hypothetical protein